MTPGTAGESASTKTRETPRSKDSSGPKSEEKADYARLRGNKLLYAIVFMGIGLIAAPGIFQMFTRAPLGKQMIDEFRPFMTGAKVGSFENYLQEIGAARDEADGSLRTLLRDEAGIGEADFQDSLVGLFDFVEEYPAIQSEMGDMLVTMLDSLDNFAAVDALPEFDLFPWFFVAPGVIVVALGLWALRRTKRRLSASTPLWLVLAIGLGLVAAPAVFQMFSRAPLGGRMIDDFRTLMNEEKVQTVQHYFLTIGGGEGELRIDVPRLLETRPGISREEYESQFPAIARFSRDWPRIANEMAPMVGAMSDNIDNFQAVDALPPFPLFPWFFVAPGLLIAGLAVVARRSGGRRLGASVAVLLLLLAACGGGQKATDQAQSTGDLIGLFRITNGECASAAASGSYFRMVQSGGNNETGPFVRNNDSTCSDKTFTPLASGADGGLLTGSYQPHPDPAFSDGLNAAASKIAQPTGWYAVKFALATNPKDPQTEADVAAPKITVSGGRLVGDLRAFAAAWNGQHFNQGSPKPDGSKPGNTTEPTGTFDASTKKFTLEWTSQIVGGAFNNFTGKWHLEGVFEEGS